MKAIELQNHFSFPAPSVKEKEQKTFESRTKLTKIYVEGVFRRATVLASLTCQMAWQSFFELLFKTANTMQFSTDKLI